MGAAYGDLPAHDGLWQSAEATIHDVAARLAVVPMVLEARGLDVTPATLDRVRASGDEAGARILERILADEIRHVRYGSDHFAKVADEQGDADELWQSLVTRYFKGAVKPPFNDSARCLPVYRATRMRRLPAATDLDSTNSRDGGGSDHLQQFLARGNPWVSFPMSDGHLGGRRAQE
jgi:uncharacterized ferritin-like protein (DUF455 family)